MGRDSVDPEDCLRSLTAEALVRADRGGPVLRVSLGLMAVANAFVMLGLLPEGRAEAILAEHRLALERKGFQNLWGVTEGELTMRPGAHGYWDARTAGSAGLREVPLSVAAAGILCPTSAVDVRFEWVKLTAAGLRMSFSATARGPGDSCPGAQSPMEQALSQVSVTDDTGHPYRLSFAGGWGRCGERQEWHGEGNTGPNPWRRPAWLEFAPVASASPGRVVLPAPSRVPTGRSDPPWPTPAECFLAALAPTSRYSINGAELGPAETAEITATVADSLIAVAALPVSSALLTQPSASDKATWQRRLERRWGGRAHGRDGQFRPGEYRGLAAQLPLDHATVVIESVSADGDLVSVRLYGHPWVTGEYWPMITPCFTVRATDDIGREHEGVPVGWFPALPGHEGTGGFWFWPPVDPVCKSMRITVGTLWEAAWAEVELPR